MGRYDFDTLADRRIDHARKWDASIVKAKFEGVPDDFIPMWIADMDFPAAPEIIEAMVEVANNGAYGYTYAHDEFYNAIIDWQARRHYNEVERAWITNSYGTVSTLHYLYQAFCQPNDCVIMNTPVYDPFGYAACNNGVRVIKNTLSYHDGRYDIDYDLLERQLACERPRIFMFCSPHNPAGRVWSLDEIERVAELCQAYGTILAVDEVHSEIILYGEFVSALQLPKRYHDNLMVFTSPNKGFNLGGLKTSYSIIPNEALRHQFRHRLEMCSITSPNVFGSTAIIAAYRAGEAWLDEMVDYLREGYEYLRDFIAQRMDGWNLMPMTASYLPWVDVSGTGMSATEVTCAMARAGVIIEDGSHYVGDGEKFVRLNLGTSHALVRECMERMERAMADLHERA